MNPIKRALRHPFSLLARLLSAAAAAVTGGVMLLVVGYVLAKGVPHLSPSLFSTEYNSDNVSMLPALFNTVYMTVLALALAAPLGVGGAIYLSEYAPKNSRFVRIVRVTAETLTGIPSILYGLFGMILFVTALKWSYSMLSGALTLAMMVLPLILRTTEEALLSVPESFREGSLALGAGKLRTVVKVVLPPASGGIFAGLILAMGRIAGETAALIYTAGTVAQFAVSPMASGSTMAVHVYVLSGEGLHVGEAYATAAVLMLIVFLMNALSSFVAKKAGGTQDAA